MNPVPKLKSGRAFAWIGLAVAALSGIFNACDQSRLASSEVGNPPSGGTVKGVITAAAGGPAPVARVMLLPIDFDPVQDSGKPGAPFYADTTDAKGAFSISGVEWNKYDVQAVDLKTRARMLIRGQDVHFDTVILEDTQALQAPGAISVLLPDSFQFKGGYIYLPGTDVHMSLDALKGESRLLYLDSIPVGASPGIFYRLIGTSAETGKPHGAIKIADGVKVVSGDTVPAGIYPEWGYSQRIYINTTAQGAGVSGAVQDFPVLVRLGPKELDFATASADGRDVRFAKKDGTTLDFEIESWDRDSGRAAIWVRLDTIRGNDSSQFFRMYWGNPSATVAAGAKPVFDTSFGYASVWHLGAMEEGTNRIRDASGNDNPLSAGGGLGASDLEPSPQGRAIRLDGNGRTLTTAKVFDDPDVYTLSLWFKTTSDSGGKLIGFGADPGIIDTSRDRHIWIDTLGKIHYGVNQRSNLVSRDIRSSVNAYNDGKWHQVTGTLSPAGMFLYLDGAEVDGDPTVTSGQVYSGYWKVGFDFKMYDWDFAPKALYFEGSIDEVRIARKAFSADWVRLSWENQRADSGLLLFRKN